MVGTGANRTPLTKVHPVLLGKKGGDSGSSLLSKHRQQHQEKLQGNSPQGQGRGPPQEFGHQQRDHGGHRQNYDNHHQSFNNQQNFRDNQHYPPSNNMHQQQQQRPPLPFNQGGGGGFGPPPPQQQQYNRQPPPPMQGHKPNQPPPPPFDDGKKKRKRSRWGAKDDKAVVTGLVTLPADLTDEQRKHYLLQFKIEEITQKLRTGELGIPADPLARSPSPEPIYNSEGKRLNTREFRVRKQLEEDRHTYIKQAIEEIPNFKPPADYKPPIAKICDKVFIPQERNPAVNFIGLLIGPRGNTLKRLEKETGCKIIIRGKGSVKEGKVGRIPGQLMPGEDEALHALITGPTEQEVKKGVKVVTEIVKEGIECPDAANELRRNQLRELAELNGTLIDEEIIKCKNCGSAEHRHWECTEVQNVTSQITCNKCGGYGHVATDCRVNLEDNAQPQQTFSEKAKMDTEYMSLMAELGVDAPPPPAKKHFQEAPPLPDSGKDTSSKSGSKWGPPAGGNPKSLMDVSVNKPSMPSPNQFRGPRPGGPSPNQGAPPPWMNQQRGGPPPPLMQGGGRPPQGGNQPPPWQQQNQMRGPPPPSNYGGQHQGPPPPSGGMPPQHNYPPPPQQGAQWPQQQATSYPAQWPNQYQYQQPAPPATNYAAPPPPWTQPPPPPPPPPPSS